MNKLQEVVFKVGAQNREVKFSRIENDPHFPYGICSRGAVKLGDMVLVDCRPGRSNLIAESSHLVSHIPMSIDQEELSSIVEGSIKNAALVTVVALEMPENSNYALVVTRDVDDFKIIIGTNDGIEYTKHRYIY